MTHQSLPSGAIVVPVGSRVTCNPPPTDTDEDYLILTKDREATINGLMSIGFEYSADPEKVAEYEEMNKSSQNSFVSLWFGDMNYIITDSAFFFERFLTATHICKTLNLLRKEDRILVFAGVRGESFSGKVVDWTPSYEELRPYSIRISASGDAPSIPDTLQYRLQDHVAVRSGTHPDTDPALQEF